MLVDCHTHLQPHGQQPPMTIERIREYLDAGAARGVTHVALTEHLFRFEEAYALLDGWWNDDPDPQLASMAHRYWKDHVTGSVADYVRLVERAKSLGMPVLLGLEMDWIHDRGDALRAFLAPYDWDIVLGSVHYIGAWGFDDPQFLDEWSRRDAAGAWADYGVLVGELAATGLADVLAHPDLPKVFGHRPTDETPLHNAILDAAAVHGTALELNSNGIRRCQEIYPAMPLLERAFARGLPITLSSDAHQPARVGADFDALIAWARRAGYAEASYVEHRARVFYSLPE
jgi:histidinol-phosphatase (PHP family)